jgi:hypothetical protein
MKLSVFASRAAAAEASDTFGEDNLPSVRAFYEERFRSLYPSDIQKRDPQTCFIPWPREPWT